MVKRKGETKDPAPDMPKGKRQRKPRAPRTELQMARDQAAAAELYLSEGLTYRQIAVRLGISPATVHRDLQEVKKDWIVTARETAEEALAEILAELGWVMSQAKAGWRASELQNPTFLQVLMGALDKKSKLLGLGQANTIKLSVEAVLTLSKLGIPLASLEATLQDMILTNAEEMMKGADYASSDSVH